MSAAARWVAAAILVVSVALPGAVSVVSPLVPNSDLAGGDLPGPHLFADNATSYNWAGYAVTAGTDQVARVAGTWVEPAVNCTKATRMVVFWVGIDGYGTATVEQVGTLAQCVQGVASYYAWWELWPLNGIKQIKEIDLQPGDQVRASVAYRPSIGEFNLTIDDLTAGASYYRLDNQTGTLRASAECITEAPSGDTNTTSDIFPLANFGAVNFTACDASIGGVGHGIGEFSPLIELTMVSDPSGAKVLASPSPLTNDREFNVTWLRP